MKARLTNYRHFKGRNIGTSSKEVEVNVIESQKDGTVLVELLEGVFGFMPGHKLAILPSQLI